METLEVLGLMILTVAAAVVASRLMNRAQRAREAEEVKKFEADKKRRMTPVVPAAAVAAVAPVSDVGEDHTELGADADDDESEEVVEKEEDRFEKIELFFSGITKDGRYFRLKLRLSDVLMFTSAYDRAFQDEESETFEEFACEELGTMLESCVDAYATTRTYQQLVDSRADFAYEIEVFFAGLSNADGIANGYACSLAPDSEAEEDAEDLGWNYKKFFSVRWIRSDTGAIYRAHYVRIAQQAAVVAPATTAEEAEGGADKKPSDVSAPSKLAAAARAQLGVELTAC